MLRLQHSENNLRQETDRRLRNQVMNASRENFLDLVETLCPHREDVRPYKCQETGRPWLRCGSCAWSCDVYAYTANPPNGDVDHFKSSRIAEAFARYTGDVNVPLKLVLPYRELEGITPVSDIIVPLRVMHNAIHLQQLVNGPFQSDRPRAKPKIFQHFLEEYMTSVTRTVDAALQQEQTAEQNILLALLKGMQQFSSTDLDLFEYYSNKLAPYVKSCLPSENLIVPVVDNTAPLAKQFYLQLRNACVIRKWFSKFSVAFDVVHVMIVCYAVSTRYELVANFAFDLMARVCRGEFFHVDSPAKKRAKAILEVHASARQDSELFYALREMKTGRSEEGLSNLIDKVGRIDELLTRHMPDDEMGRHQAFPAVAFDDNADYLGFVTALSHVIHSTHGGRYPIPKGAIATGRRIHRVVRMLASSIANFESDGTRVFWTMDTFQAFLASDPDLERHISEIAAMVISSHEED